MCDNREELVQRAKFAHKLERYDDMARAMKKVTELGYELSIDEHNLLWVAYQKAVGARRACWRDITSIAQKAEGSATQQQQAKAYREEVEREMRAACNEILHLLDTFLIPTAGNAEMKVCYLTRKGDYYRYLAEIAIGEARNDAVEKSEQSYQEAFDIAKEKLQATSIIRLGVALNFSVLCYEILGAPDKAYHIAKQAYDDAIAELDTLDEDSYKDSTLRDTMQRLRDNIALCSSDASDHEQEVRAGDEMGEHLAAGIVSLVEKKLQEASILTLDDLLTRLTGVDPAIGDLLDNDEGKLRSFLEEKCAGFVDIAIHNEEVLAFYSHPSP